MSGRFLSRVIRTETIQLFSFYTQTIQLFCFIFRLFEHTAGCQILCYSVVSLVPNVAKFDKSATVESSGW